MLESIIKFQKAGGHTVAFSQDNHIPSLDDRILRLKLIFEELSELASAYGLENTFSEMCEKHSQENSTKQDTLEFDKIESLDALCDLSVVVNGGYCISGFTDIAQQAYEETMDSNMSKFCYTLDEALATVAHKEDWTYKATEINGKTVYVFLRKEDGKIMKGTGFYKPNYEKFFSE